MAVVLVAPFGAGFADVLVGIFAATDAFAPVLVAAGFAIDLPEAALVAAAPGFFAADFAAGVAFAGFFIAFAMDSIQMIALLRREVCAW
ncbi:MAG TPA: hypothetical protein VM406_03055 [Noviherbaspirillum sp.]|nr:hypothetical protein [Noviherbaspirillum sp.]